VCNGTLSSTNSTHHTGLPAVKQWKKSKLFYSARAENHEQLYIYIYTAGYWTLYKQMNMYCMHKFVCFPC